MKSAMRKRGIWLEHRLEAGKHRFNMPSAFLLRGKADAAILGKAFETLVARHESLRTVFKDDNGTVKQQIKSVAECGFHFELLHQQDAQTLRQVAEALSAEPFDLENGPLIRVHLLMLPHEKRSSCSIPIIFISGWLVGSCHDKRGHGTVRRLCAGDACKACSTEYTIQRICRLAEYTATVASSIFNRSNTGKAACQAHCRSCSFL